uniref:Putative ribosomal protein S2, flavodoxin-like domain-containing protein n=1 Tax=Helianthus annuus TaxID=4232 RepID=A0A251UPD1_HELAN
MDKLQWEKQKDTGIYLRVGRRVVNEQDSHHPFLSGHALSPQCINRNQKINLTSVNRPDCVVIFDIERKSSVILEATRLQIPIVGLECSLTNNLFLT